MSNTTNKKDRLSGMLAAVIAILVVLTVLSGILLLLRLIGSIKSDEKEVRLTSNFDTDFNLFSVQYENERGEITVSGSEGQKVVAPGTSAEYTIRLRNADKIALDYALIPTVSFTSDHHIPLQVRMLDRDGNYIIGDAKTWVDIKDMKDMSATRTLAKGESTEYYFQWKWNFESGNDELDTYLGSMANKENIGLSVSVDVHAEASADIETNGGLISRGNGNIIWIAIVLILLVLAIVLLVIYAICIA